MDSNLSKKLERFKSGTKTPEENAQAMARALLQVSSEIAAMTSEEITAHYAKNGGTDDISNRNVGFNMSAAVATIADDFDAVKAMIAKPGRESNFKSLDLKQDTLEASLSYKKARTLGQQTGHGERLTNLAHGMFQDSMSFLTQVLYPRSQRQADELCQDLRRAGSQYFDELVKHFKSILS